MEKHQQLPHASWTPGIEWRMSLSTKGTKEKQIH